MWTYSGDPAASTKDTTRFLLGDTNQSDPQLSDEEIAYLLTEHGTPELAAANGAEARAAFYASQIDRTVGTLSIAYSQRSGQFASLAKRLRDKASRDGAYSATVIWESDEVGWEDRLTNPDMPPPIFGTGMHDNEPTEGW